MPKREKTPLPTTITETHAPVPEQSQNSQAEDSQFELQPSNVAGTRSGFAGILGRPNAGKSTLLNRLVGEKIAAVSNKPQTTRTRIQGIVTNPEGQIIFVDTPGIHKPGYKLNKRMMQAVQDTLATVDVVLLLRDASAPTGNGDRYVLNLVKEAARPTFLLLNKTDKLEDKSALLPLLEWYKAEYDFLEYIPLSALKGDNLNLLTRKILEHLPEGPYLFEEDALTDQTERTLVAELVREQLLNQLSEELPFATAVLTERWETQPNGVLKLSCVIYVERESQRAIVLGRGGDRIKQIATQARKNIEKMMETRVFLELFVKVQQHWRNDEKMLDLMGIETNQD
ncbi:MAG: GTPase Era [Blastocatellia bacterium]|nr:GTPase Era [Blastocatellia bacterium]